jgi:ABC-type transporter Mla subunit MlaD
MSDVAGIELTKLIEEAEKALREGAYVTVGLGVMAFQRAQVRRHELAKRLAAERATLGARLPGGVEAASAQLGDLASQLGALASQLSDNGERLSEQLGETGRALNANVESLLVQIHSLLEDLDGRVAPARRQLDEQVDALEQRLPEAARNVVSAVRSAVAAPEARLRSAVGLS